MSDPTNPSEPEPGPSAPDAAAGPGFTAGELRRHAQEISALYPPPRLGTEVVLLDVSPHRAHAYWNVDVDDYRAAVSRAGGDAPAMLLRIHDVTDRDFDGVNSLSYFDIQVQGLQGHWYIDLWKAGRAYLAELGLRPNAGAFLPMARSNPVSTPRASESDTYHTRAVDVGRPDGRELDLTGLAGSEAEAGRAVDPDPPPVPPAPRAGGAEFHPAGAPAEGPAPSAALQPHSTPDDAARREEVHAHWPTAEELSRHVPDTSGAAPAAVPAAGCDAPPPGPAPAAAPPEPERMALDQYVRLTSYADHRPQVALEINVELCIHGRAKPGAQLTLYGVPVPLQPDGSFSIRKPLPHGAVVLPLLAVDPPPPG